MSSYEKLSIKEWSVEDRPREKLLAKGICSLTDAELIAILIRSGTARESAVDLAKRILNTTGNNLNELSRLSVYDLQKFNGIGEAKAISIIAALELGRRRKLSEVLQKKQITSSRDVFDFFQPFLGDISHEEFWVLHLSRSNRIMAWKKISQGGIAGTVTDIRLILKDALENTATSIVICHNHPSGNLQPSHADTEITKKIKEAAGIMEIRLLDHVIIGNNKYFSFADEGLI
ncbi:MAG TPA: JAB domain-containing protein [Bacteroidetes bacterium]|nr:JAB domain-containing protein [Bacteroidota bacterium]